MTALSTPRRRARMTCLRTSGFNSFGRRSTLTAAWAAHAIAVPVAMPTVAAAAVIDIPASIRFRSSDLRASSFAEAISARSGALEPLVWPGTAFFELAQYAAQKDSHVPNSAITIAKCRSGCVPVLGGCSRRANCAVASSGQLGNVDSSGIARRGATAVANASPKVTERSRSVPAISPNSAAARRYVDANLKSSKWNPSGSAMTCSPQVASSRQAGCAVSSITSDTDSMDPASGKYQRNRPTPVALTVDRRSA